MSLLLDTHIFLWFAFAQPELNAYARSLVEDEARIKFLSLASIWEMAIKHSAGKLPLAVPFADFVRQQVEQNDFRLLPIGINHLVRVSALPMHHRDPFDRLLIAQCLEDQMPIISADAAFDVYGISRLW